ncbi:hypothetical protein [Erwinia sp.]|uniref:hypothetical protein n=1 Tax=Erwinia citreus TaxID=558 RepID=UPI003C709832
MRTSLLWGLLLIPALVSADGSLVIHPQPNGTLRLIVEGGSGGAGRLIQRQPAGEAITLHILPTGPARCENGNLAVPPLTLILQVQQDDQRLICGQPIRLEAVHQDRLLLVLASASLKGPPSALLQQAGSPVTQIGRVSFTVGNRPPVLFSVSLDLNELQQQSAKVSATFDSPTVSLGLIGDRQNNNSNARLRVTKTALAPSAALNYKLSFESSQQRDNQWNLRAQTTERLVPYQIHIGKETLVPGSEYQRTLPAGKTTSDVIMLEFSLAGKQTWGLPAGTRLLDTLTAVITPDS